MQHVFGDAAHQLRLCLPESALRGFLVAAGDRRLDALHESPDPADPCPVDCRPARRLTDALFGSLGVRHCHWSCLNRAWAYKEHAAPASSPTRPAVDFGGVAPASPVLEFWLPLVDERAHPFLLI